MRRGCKVPILFILESETVPSLRSYNGIRSANRVDAIDWQPGHGDAAHACSDLYHFVPVYYSIA